MMAYLPPDVIPNICYRLPVESLFRFRCVCRSWRAIIDDPLLREMHTHRFMLDVVDKQSGSDSDYSSVSFLILARLNKQKHHEFHFGDYFDEDEDELLSPSSCYNVTKPIKHLRIQNFNRRQHSQETSTIVGSCNGLVCYASNVPHQYLFLYVLYVFNPVTNEYLRIPTFDKSFKVDMSVNGFGYLPSTNEYKVVRIYYDFGHDYDHDRGQVEIYTLGSGVWRSIGEIPSIFVSFVRLPGVLVNEALHWIDDSGKIALFDLETEIFRMVSSPSPLTLVSDNAHYYELGVMGGRRSTLCVIEHNIHKNVDIWVMDDSIGEGSWTMKFKIPIGEGSCHDEFKYDWEEFDDYNFVTITKSGKVLLWYNGTWLVSYDPITEEFTLHGDYKADPSWFEAVIHRKSFVSIKALGEDSVIMPSVEVRGGEKPAEKKH